jgi:hypothetical protein
MDGMMRVPRTKCRRWLSADAHWCAKLRARCLTTITSPTLDHICLFWLFQSLATIIKHLSYFAAAFTVLLYRSSCASRPWSLLTGPQQQTFEQPTVCIAHFIIQAIVHAEDIRSVADASLRLN